MQFVVTGIAFYCLGWAAGYAAGRTRRLTIPFYILDRNGSRIIHERQVDWDEELKKLKEKKDGE